MFNLVCDRATLVVAWERVAGNRGARTAGVDAVTRHAVERSGVLPFLEDLRSSLRDASFAALPVRQTTIPKRGGKVRYLGIPTLRDRVAQMALKLVLEPIFEVDFYPSSYGYRPGRRAQDAIAEIHHFTAKPSSYEWVIEGDITACLEVVRPGLLHEVVDPTAAALSTGRRWRSAICRVDDELERRTPVQATSWESRVARPRPDRGGEHSDATDERRYTGSSVAVASR